MAMYMPSQLSRKFSALSKKYFKNHVDFVGSKLFIGNVWDGQPLAWDSP